MIAVALDLIDFVGRVTFDPIALPRDAAKVWIEMDAAVDRRGRFALSLEFSPDGGATWEPWATSTHSGGCDIGINADGMLERADGLARNKHGNDIVDFRLEQSVDLTGFAGAPLIRGTVDSLAIPVNSQARMGVA